MIFKYQAKDKKGGASSGTIEAQNYEDALSGLKGKGLFVVKMMNNAPLNSPFSQHVSVKDKIIFTKQLALMLRSGLSIIDALESIKEETSSKYLQTIVSDLSREIQGGKKLSAALNNYPDVFGQIYINMVSAGEESGKAEEVLERIASQLEKDYELNRKIRSALAYPIIVLVVLVVVMIIVVTYIIPGLSKIFEQSNVELPPITRAVLAISDLFVHYGLWMLLALISLVLLGYLWQRSEGGKIFFAKCVVKIPIIGDLLKKSYVSRFCRTFAALFAAGLPLLDALKSSGEVMVNLIYVKDTYAIADRVKSGTSLSLALKNSAIFPKMVGQMATVGEKSGNLDEVFSNLADFYDREIDNTTSNISTLLEPILIVVMGIGIALVILSVLQPIYGLVDAI